MQSNYRRVFLNSMKIARAAFVRVIPVNDSIGLRAYQTREPGFSQDARSEPELFRLGARRPNAFVEMTVERTGHVLVPPPRNADRALSLCQPRSCQWA